MISAVGKPIGKLKEKAFIHISTKLLVNPRFIKVTIKDMKMLMNNPSNEPVNIPEYFFEIFFMVWEIFSIYKNSFIDLQAESVCYCSFSIMS